MILNVFEDVPENKIYKMFKEHFDTAGALHIDILRDMYKYSEYYPSYFSEGNISSDRARVYAKQLMDIYGAADRVQISVRNDSHKLADHFEKSL